MPSLAEYSNMRGSRRVVQELVIEDCDDFALEDEQEAKQSFTCQRRNESEVPISSSRRKSFETSQNIEKSGIRRGEGPCRVSNNAISSRRKTDTSSTKARVPSEKGGPRSEAMDDETAKALRSVLMGDGRTAVPPSWRRQGFPFVEYEDLGFGIKQLAGGPCGILAAIQAHVLDYLLFNSSSTWKNPTTGAKRRALIQAITRVIWRAGKQQASAVYCTFGTRPTVDRSPQYTPDGITERLRLWRTDSEVDLEAIIAHHVRDLEAEGGVLILLYSALLSRGLDHVKSDADALCGSTPLIDQRGYASQEAVNLLLIGQAVSNVFDGVKSLDDQVQGSKDVVTLKGIPHRADLGLLSLDESYGYYQVGHFLKKPRRPIWLVYSESHYSVLFTTEDPEQYKKLITLYYWDGLGGQQESIQLTIDPNYYQDETSFRNSRKHKLPDANDPSALIPPLDLVIRTKWPTAHVDWNDADPIL